jgi:hypothetical protein
MTTTELSTAFDRQELRALYDQAVVKINAVRKNNLLTTGFYARTGDAVFDVGCLALSDAITDTRRMHTVAAPPGGGKTSFSHAFVIAFTRYADNRPDAPYGAVFVVDQMEKADEVFCELSRLLPGKVAIWTTDHDLHRKEPKKVKEPAAQFMRDELQRYPVIVVTHKFYLGSRGHLARTVVHNGVSGVRALTVVDEKPDEAPMIEITLAEAQAVREALLNIQPETKVHLDALFRFMEKTNYVEANKLYRPGIELDADAVTKALSWFRTAEATYLTQSADVPGIKKLFAFAKALAAGRACVATSGALPHFFGYEEHRIIDLTAGTVLLDATADIDGISNIVPRRLETETPKARYSNLEIIHVPQHTKTRLSQYLKTAPNQRAYVDYMIETIMQHSEPGQKVLVICKNSLFEAQRVPNWPEGDPRFDDSKSYTEDYGWNLEGRKLCATHWGTGVGSNAWKDAEVVFLFDEFFIPRRVYVATTQGYRGDLVHEGDLGSMKTLTSKARGVDSIADGHTLRWIKQLALRGRARFYDENGVCGKQRLVVGSDLTRFTSNVHKLFPGAKVLTAGNHDNNATLATRILTLLSSTKERMLSTKVLSEHLGKPWKDVSSNVLTSEFLSSLMGLGWCYVSKMGRGGSRFERLLPNHTEGGALSSHVRSNAAHCLA